MDTSRMTIDGCSAARSPPWPCSRATAHAATLTPLKPCYISVTQRTPGDPPEITRERLDLAGSGFTPGALVDVSLDGTLERTIQADAAGNLPPQVAAVALPRARRGPVHADRGRAGQPGQRGLAGRRARPRSTLGCARARPSPRAASASAAAASPRRARSGRTTSTRARCARPCGWCGGSTTPAGVLRPPPPDPGQAPAGSAAGRCRSTSSAATAARPTASSSAS